MRLATKVAESMCTAFVKLARQIARMMYLSFSKFLFNRAAVLFCLMALPLLSFAHPELLSQIAQLNLQLEQRPGDAGLLLKRGDLYRRDGNYKAAGQDFTEAAKMNPLPDALAFYEGRLYLDTDRPEAALASFSQYIEDHPGHVKTRVLRSQALLLLDRPVEAADDLGRAIELAENPSPALYRDQAMALIAAGEGHWPEAASVILCGLQRFPVEISLLALGTDLALARADTVSAIAFINKLPPALQQLPEWQKRLDLATSLDEATKKSRRL